MPRVKEIFYAGAKDLVAMGADGIGTTCGFLSLFQDDIAEGGWCPSREFVSYADTVGSKYIASR